MIITRTLIIILGIICTFSIAVPGELKERRTAHLSMPISEAVFRVKRFLGNDDHFVEQSSLKNNRVRISTKQEKERESRWVVELEPYSSLGTKIEVVVEGAEVAAEDADQFIEMLSEESAGELRSGSINSQVIPEAVLNQIGNVACIHVETKGQLVQFTGFFIDKGGLILCTAHDLLEHERVQILSNTGIYYEGDIVKADFDRDLALIKVDAVKEEIVSAVDGRNLLGMGETVFSIGCPRNLRGTIESGFVNGPPRKIKDIPLWQVHMRIQPGGSGSPVFDSNGTFVAVVKGRHREAEDVGFLIPLEVVVDFLKDYFSL